MVSNAWLLLLGVLASSGTADAREPEDHGRRLVQLGAGGEVLLGVAAQAGRRRERREPEGVERLQWAVEPGGGLRDVAGKGRQTHLAKAIATGQAPELAASGLDSWTGPPALQAAAATMALRDTAPHGQALLLPRQAALDDSQELLAQPAAAAAAPTPAAAQGSAHAEPASLQARQRRLARKEPPAPAFAWPPPASPLDVGVAGPEASGTPAPPTHGYSPHPLLVTTLVVCCLFGLVVGNALYEKNRRARLKRSRGARPPPGAAASGAEGGAPEGEGRAAEGGAAEGGAAEDGAAAAAEGDNAEGEDDSDSDDETLTTEPLSEDTYGMAIASMVRDMNHLMKEQGSGHRGIRVCRIAASVKLLLINMLLQIFLLVCIAEFAAARAVWTIRSAYSKFEEHMYAGHIYQSAHGNARGLDDKYFNTSLFDSLSEETKGDACRIPFAQPHFLFVILLIWSLLVVGEIKESAQLFERLVVNTDTTASMADATQPGEEGDMVIVKLTLSMKAWVTFFIVLPRIIIASILLWLGCRWLSATTDFQNLVLNAVGLEFVLLLKELLYKSLVPQRDKRDTVRMHVSIAHEATRPSPVAFFGTFLWGFVAMAWVYLYIFCIQGVLPGFRWDVHDVCVKWMKQNSAGWS